MAPGLPDASALYLTMLQRHRPLDVFYGPVPGPTSQEAQAVRAWIAGLDPDNVKCDPKLPLTRAALAADMSAWINLVGKDAAKDTRFVSLASLHNQCTPEKHMAQYRDAAMSVLKGLAKPPAQPVVETVGEASALLAVRLSQLGWSVTQWQEFAARVGALADEPVPADGLAFAALAPPLSLDVKALSQPSAAASIDGLDPFTALARSYRRPVDITRAAAELGITAAGLQRRLEAAGPGPSALGRRLSQGFISRRDWVRLRRFLDATADADASNEQSSDEGAVALSLWSDASHYKTGDTLRLSVVPSCDCNLTVVSVSSKGDATVLFPNDFEPNNRVTARQQIDIPPANAGYRVKLNERGSETVVAICQAQSPRPEGIGHNFEQQRFTILGNWEALLANTTAREAAFERVQEELHRFRSNRRNARRQVAEPAHAVLPPVPVGPEWDARTAITLTVE